MDSSLELSCPLCCQEYSEQRLPRLLTACGHTFCELCIHTIIIPKKENLFKIVCPEDGSVFQSSNNSIDQFPKNLALLAVIESHQKSSFQKNSFDVSKIAQMEELQEDEDTKQLITAIKDCQMSNNNSLNHQDSTDIRPEDEDEEGDSDSNEKELKKNDKDCSSRGDVSKSREEEPQEEDDEENMCLLHQKPLEVVCVVDLKRICAKCAIFGEHKGHEFKSIEEIEQEKQQFYNSILQIYEEKQSIQQRIDKKTTKADLIQILVAKKEALAKQIKERFKKLIESVKSEEKKTTQKLQKLVLKAQRQIEELYKIDPATQRQYELWESTSYEKLKIMEEGTFEEKLELLILDQNEVKDKRILDSGQSIIQKMQSEENEIMNVAETLLSDICLNNDDRIFKSLESYVEVHDKPRAKEEATEALRVIEQKAKGKSLPNKNKIQEKLSAELYDQVPEALEKRESNLLLQTSEGKKAAEQDLLDYGEIDESSVSTQQQKSSFRNEAEQVRDVRPRKRTATEPQKQKIPILNNSSHGNFNQHQINSSLPNSSQSVGGSDSFDQTVQSNNLRSGNGIKESRKVQKKTPSVICVQKLEQQYGGSSVASSNKKANTGVSSRDTSFVSEQYQRPPKKKLRTIKVGQKFEKTLDSLYNDTIEVLDFTNAELGDETVLQICEFIPGTKTKTIKFIRNKLTDDCIGKMLPFVTNAITLNLSQNLLTERVLDIFIQNREMLPKVKSIILSQNKIIERKHKLKIEALRKLEVTVSV